MITKFIQAYGDIEKLPLLAIHAKKGRKGHYSRRGQNNLSNEEQPFSIDN